jgi:hypothetical protein
MTVLKHSLSELIARVPHRQSLSLWPKGKATGTDESWFGQFSSIHSLLSRKGSVVRNNVQSITSRACVSPICVASPDTRRRACPLSSKDAGRQRARRAPRPALSPPSLWARGCLLPAVLGVRRIPYRTMTGATHGAPLPPLGRRDPARIRARANGARWGEGHVVAALSGIAQRHRRGLPDRIMPVGFLHQGMGDLMQERVVNGRVWGRAGIRLGEGDALRLRVAAARAWRDQTGNFSPRAGAPRSRRWRVSP